MIRTFVVGMLLAMACIAPAVAQAPTAQPPAVAQCPEVALAAKDLPKEIDIYTVNRQYEDSLKSADLGPTLKLLDCGDASFFGFLRNGQMKLVRRASLQIPKPKTIKCFCPSVASDRTRTDLSAPGLGGANFCKASECPSRK